MIFKISKLVSFTRQSFGRNFGLTQKALDETLEFEKAIEIVVSSDHSHAFTVAGYSVSYC